MIMLTHIKGVKAIVLTDEYFTLYPYFGTPITVTLDQAIAVIKKIQRERNKEARR